MIEKQIEALSGRDFEALVDNRRAEGRRLEFKRDLPGRTDNAKKEFLADLSAFANTDGGNIVFGITEEDGAASEIVGVGEIDLEAEILRLESLVNDGLDPRLPHVRFAPFEVGETKRVLLARIEASLLAPHRVTLGGTSRFYGRHSSGKFEMDTGQLRRAFAATDELPRQMRDLHKRAISRLTGEDMPGKLEPGPVLIFTLAPLSIQRELRDLDVTKENAVLPPYSGGGFEFAVGLEGVVTFSSFDRSNRQAAAWAYNYRSGYIDQAWTIGRMRNDTPLIWPKYVQQYLQGALTSAIVRLREHQVDGPWVAMVTLVGVKGFRATFGDDYVTDPAWQNEAYLGEIIDERMEVAALEPIWRSFLRLVGLEQMPPWINQSQES